MILYDKLFTMYIVYLITTEYDYVNELTQEEHETIDRRSNMPKLHCYSTF